MIKKYLSIPALLFASFFSGSIYAQTTGSYDTTISFMSTPRALSLYVPTSYSAANKYQLMICLHGLGDTCNNYSSALINSLGWASSMPKTIFVCPEAVTRNSDYYSPAGGEAIVQQSIAFAMSHYHIDTANIILQGFSLGGRAALRYGLDNYGKFKGLLLNTPAVQGVKEALNGHAAYYSFTYANAAQIPIYITHGATDIAYESSIDSAFDQMVLNDGIVHYVDVPGLGHAIPAMSQMSDFSSFFNSPAHPGKDADAVRFYPVPLLNCTTPLGATLLFRNAGKDTIRSVKFRYTLGSATQTGIWTGTLLPFQHAVTTVNFPSAAAGDNAVTVQVDTLNGTVPDTVLGNNQQSTTLHYDQTPLPTLGEGFEGASFPPAGWVLQQSGDFYTAWDVDNTVAKAGVQSAGTFNTILFFDNAGRSEGLITPLVAVGSTKPQLSFDLTYNYHRYTPPYFTATTDFADTLEVLVSTDCGAHYSSLYKKGGANLATFSNPILNPLNVQSDFISPADSNWRTERIDLSSLTAGGIAVNAVFKFNYISALGGSINIDNVQVRSVTETPPVVRTNYRIYPNPVKDYLIIEGAASTNISLTNSLGQEVMNMQTLSENQQKISLQMVPAGVYLLTITAPDGSKSAARIVKSE